LEDVALLLTFTLEDVALLLRANGLGEETFGTFTFSG
jgi:hypothetical protein